MEIMSSTTFTLSGMTSTKDLKLKKKSDNFCRLTKLLMRAQKQFRHSAPSHSNGWAHYDFLEAPQRQGKGMCFGF